jgi:hypothetical protein
VKFQNAHLSKNDQKEKYTEAVENNKRQTFCSTYLFYKIHGFPDDKQK